MITDKRGQETISRTPLPKRPARPPEPPPTTGPVDARHLRLIRRYNVPWWLLGITRAAWPKCRPRDLQDYLNAWCPA